MDPSISSSPGSYILMYEFPILKPVSTQSSQNIITYQHKAYKNTNLYSNCIFFPDILQIFVIENLLCRSFKTSVKSIYPGAPINPKAFLLGVL